MHTASTALLSAGLLAVASFAEAGPTQNTQTIDGIIETSYDFLDAHICEGEKWGLPYHFRNPSTEKYSRDQWLWDSGSHIIVEASRNITSSILELRTMLQMQQPDGRIPEEIFWQERNAKENAEIRLQYSNDKFTDTTQMPVLPWSLQRIYERSGKDKRVLEEFLLPIVDYFDWWREERDEGVDNDGLVTIVHGWESGLDASPALDPAYKVYVTEVNQTSFQSLYPRFVELIATYNFAFRWDMNKILKRKTPMLKGQKLESFFLVKDLAVNSVYATGWEVLADLAKELGDADTADHCYLEFQKSSEAIHKKMWSSQHFGYRTLYKDNITGRDKFSPANTIHNLFPLLLSNLPKDRSLLLQSQLADKNKFDAPYPIPTVALDDPQFSATFDFDLMWRGPAWGFTNWFVMEGLHRQGRDDMVDHVLDGWVALVQKSGIYEHYNVLTGEPYGAVGLGMSTLIVDWLYRTGRAIPTPVV